MTLYHYTNSNGFLGITNKANDKLNLWFTNYKYLNDSSEGEELLHIYKDVIDEMAAKEEIDESIYAELNAMRFNDKHIYAYTTTEKDEPLTHIMREEDDAFICCFSKNGDSLDMWRYYSKNDTGYAIGFFDFVLQHEALIRPFSPDEKRVGKFLWRDVIYDNDEKKKTIYNLINDKIKSLKKHGLPLEKNLFNTILFELQQYQFFFKHECFKSEEEVRCVLTIPKAPEKIATKEYFNVLYRAGNGTIIPYVVVPFPRKSIYSVTVSPTAPESAEETIKEYLSTYTSHSVIIERSKLPMRF